VLFRALERIGKFGPDLKISRVFCKTDAKMADSLVPLRAPHAAATAFAPIVAAPAAAPIATDQTSTWIASVDKFY